MPEDPERALWKIMNADRYDPVLREAMRSPGLLGDDLLAFLFMLIYKPPQVPDSVHPFHQDGLYFQFEPHDLVVGAWLPLDPMNEENGTLCVVPGTHRLPITGHEVIPGDCVLFHPHLYHRTGGNLTDRHRRVLTIHFASARCRSLTPTQPDVYAFTLVRGSTHRGGLQPAVTPELGFRSDDVRL